MSETTPLKDDKNATASTSTNTNETTDAANPKEPNYLITTAILLAMLGVGTGAAYGSLFLDSDAGVAARAAKLSLVASMDLKWVYGSLILLGRTVALLNFVPTGYKNGMKGNARANPFFFETADAQKTVVLYREDGFHGRYNRSNRSLQHMVENSGAFFAAVGPVGWLFPRPTFAAVAVFCAGRVLHQRGYASGYGSHALGFVLALLALLTVEGLALLACIL